MSYKINFQKTIFGLCGLCTLFFSCHKDTPSIQEADTTFAVIQPLLKDTTYSQEYVAELMAVQNIEIRSKIKGYLTQIHVDEGQTVRQGEMLFDIASEELKQDKAGATAALKSAEAEARIAELELNNIRLLVEKNVVSKAELDMAQAKWDVLKAKVEEAQAEQTRIGLQISFTEIKAPFNGIINRIPYKTGSLIDEGTLLTNLSNNEELFAYFNLSEKEYLEFRSNEWAKNKLVNLRLVNNSLYPHQGQIEIIVGEFNKETGNIAVRVRFPNPDRLLKHGESGKVIVEKPLKNALLIPQKTTFEIQHKSYVYVVEEDTVRMQSIFPKFKLGNWLVIESGLKPTDKVLFEGIQLVKEGDKINTETTKTQKK
jgi:RND family efflux transporter MFP subunit